jgi:hypothetical protein
MSSSYALSLRLQDIDKYKIKGATYGDVYIRPYGNCHPDFVSVPINSPSGPRVCIRKIVVDTEPAHPTPGAVVQNVGDKYTDSKDITRDRTRTDPGRYSKMPNQDQLVKDDYLRWGTRYDGLGFPSKQLYYSNGYSITPTKPSIYQ